MRIVSAYLLSEWLANHGKLLKMHRNVENACVNASLVLQKTYETLSNQTKLRNKFIQ